MCAKCRIGGTNCRGAAARGHYNLRPLRVDTDMWQRLLASALLALALNPADAQPRPRIEKDADLPRFPYPISERLDALVRDPKAFNAFAAAVRRDTESVLAKYEIADKSSERQLLGTLLQLDLLDGRDADALKRIEQIRVLQEKPADKLLTGLQARAIIDGRKAAGSTSGPAYISAGGESLATALNPLPYDVIAHQIKEPNDRAAGRRDRRGPPPISLPLARVWPRH